MERRGDELRARLPAYDRLARGAALAFGVAPALAIAAWTVAAIVGLPSLMAVGIAAGAAGALAVVPAVVGWALMITARRRAARGEVVIDLAERLIRRPSGAPEVLRSPDVVRVARGRLGGWRLAIVGPEGHTTVLVSGAPRASGRRIARAAEELAEALDAKLEVPTVARRARGLVPSRPRTWAALCVAPIDGLLVAYSMWALITSRDAFVRFFAKQSLAQLALELGLLFAILGCLGGPLALLVDAAGVRAVGMACPLGALALFRVAARVTAAIRAHRGEVWVMPWLAPIARRWAPRR